MAAVRRKQAHRQPAPPDMRTLIHEAAINGASRMEISTPAAGAVTAWQSPAVNGGAFGSAVAVFIYGLGSLLKLSPAEIMTWCSITGGFTTAVGMVAWAVSQGKQDAIVQYFEFDNGNGHVPAGEPVRDARFVKPDAARPGHVVELPGDWTAERLRAFARRLAQVDYDVTVRSWVPQFCSYEQLKALLDWLEQHELVQVTDGRGTKAVRARAKRIMQQWADGHIDAL